MRWSDVSFTNRALRQFAVAWLVVFGLLALTRGYMVGHWTSGVIFAVVAATVGVTGLVWPGAVRPIYVAAIFVTFPLGLLLSSVFLALIYYVFMTPIALVLRFCRDDVLQRRPMAEEESYWRRRPQAMDTSRYLRQF